MTVAGTGILVVATDIILLDKSLAGGANLEVVEVGQHAFGKTSDTGMIHDLMTPQHNSIDVGIREANAEVVVLIGFKHHKAHVRLHERALVTHVNLQHLHEALVGFLGGSDCLIGQDKWIVVVQYR